MKQNPSAMWLLAMLVAQAPSVRAEALASAGTKEIVSDLGACSVRADALTTRQDGDTRVIGVRGKGTVNCTKAREAQAWTATFWDGEVRLLQPAGGGVPHLTIRASRIERPAAKR